MDFIKKYDWLWEIENGVFSTCLGKKSLDYDFLIGEL